MTAFPAGFLFGCATGAHQIEGGNVNSDWWAWEHQPGTACVEPSGDATDFYHRYGEDLALLADLGLNAFRFSLEWARIEPAEGEFSQAAIDHYARVLEACRDHGVAPFLTFHHFTLPRWLQELGGFESPRFPDLFERYCERVAPLARPAAYAATINEPESLAQGGYVLGVNPPGRRRDLAAMWRVTENLLAAHARAAPVIRAAAGVAVGVTLAMSEVQYEDGAQPGELLAELSAQISDRFLEAARGDDYVGVQTYTRIRIGPDGVRSASVGWNAPGVLPPETETTSQMGYELYPPALGATIRRAWQRAGGIPVVVSENGIATEDDEKRVRFVRASLEEVLTCLADGVDLRGYLYWTFIDNFEWAFGYRPKFGLVAFDRATFARMPKPSARWFGEVARSGSLPGCRG